MKKIAKFLTLPLAVMAALSFSACDFSSSSSSSSQAPTESSSSSVPADSSSIEESSSLEESSSSEEEYVAPTSVADAVNVAVANAGKVVTGEATKIATTRAGEGDGITISNLTYSKINGKYLETKMVTNPDSDDSVTEINRYSLMDNGTVFGVVYDQGNDQWNPAYEPTEEDLMGYTFFSGDMLYAKGVENWINALYSFAVELPAENKTNVPLMESVEDGIYSFMFDYATSLYYKVYVSFTLDENGMCDSFNWIINSWYNGQTQDDEGNWLTMETTDAEGNPITVPAGADWSGEYKADFAWDVENEYWYLISAEDSWNDSQVWGHTQSAEGEVIDEAAPLCITNMDIVDMEGNEIPDTITLMAGGEEVVWQMTNIVPETGVLTANNIAYAYEQDAMDNWALNIEVGYTDWETWEDFPDRIKLSSSTAGEYNLSIMVNGKEVKKVLVKVEAPVPESMNATAWINSEAVDMGDAYEMFAGTTLVVSGLADNMSADHSSEIVVTDANGNEVDCWTATSVYHYSAGEINAIAFAPMAIGTYTITVTSTVVDGLTDSVVVNVVEAPSYLDVFNGNYNVVMYGEIMGTIEFATGTTENTGTATISMEVISYDEEWNMVRETVVSVYNWTITEENGVEVFSKTLAEGSSLLDFDVDGNFNLVVTRDEDGYIHNYETEKIVVRTYAEILSGSYNIVEYGSVIGSVVFADGQATITYSVEVQDPDTFEFTWVEYTAVFSYTVDAESFEMTAVSGDTDLFDISISDSYKLVVSANVGEIQGWGEYWADLMTEVMYF